MVEPRTSNKPTEEASILAQVATVIEQLQRLTQLDVQQSWRLYPGDLEPTVATQPQSWQNWPIARLNPKQHIAWTKGQQVLWLGQTFVVPSALQTYPLAGLTLRLALTWWAEQATIFVNGQPVQAGDLFDHSARILLSPAVKPGETIAVALRLVSPGHDDGALVKSRLIYEPIDSDRLDPAMAAAELAVLRSYLERLRPEALPDLAAAIAAIDWPGVADPARFERSLQHLHQTLAPYGAWLKQRQIHLLGHAHLDLAWLWPVSETWEVAERTFQSVLQLQAEFPELIFSHSSPALYAWIETHRPDLFAAIQTQVAAGRWEVAAGLWVEPELNLISGESLVRQVLYGQRYVQEKFGAVSAIAWLPDSFGFCWQLPQILKQGGVEYFVTQKLRWNDTTTFPHAAFWWRSPDGSQILSVMSAPIGEGIDPPRMAEFGRDWELATGHTSSLWLPGVGDHGGGPTRDMLEVARRWQTAPLFPQIQFSSAEQWLRQFQTQAQDLPIWTDELYLEFHRGCYTTHAAQKRANRQTEQLLVEAELFAAIATLTAGVPYPKADLEQAWKLLLFNQFHDILPGSAIPAVFEDANRAWAEVQHLGTTLRQAAWSAIAAQIALPPPPQPDSQPLLVFNSLNWSRSEVIRLPLPPGESHWRVDNLEGQPVPTQYLHPTTEPTLLFWAEAIPALGYRLFWLTPDSSDRPLVDQPFDRCETTVDPSPKQGGEQLPALVLENPYLRVEVDRTTGNLASLFDKTHQRQVLSGPGNQLQFFQDQGQYWDAWNIDPDYASHPLPEAELQSIQWLDRGPLQTRLRVVRQFGRSQFCQDYVLEAHAVSLRIETTVDWQERQVLVKAAFPLTVSAPAATYEIPCGAIARPTLPNPQPLEPRDLARWEVPALHWADLTETSASDTYGVSLLNDCKYGYDAQPNQLRLTLLRSPNWPDPQADLGRHQLTYAIYPHAGSWQAAHTVQHGYELNRPLQVYQPQPATTPVVPKLPPQHQFLRLEADNLILMALKQSETDPSAWIGRWYECCGESAPFVFDTALPLTLRHPVDLLEQAVPEAAIAPSSPWKIVSVLLSA